MFHFHLAGGLFSCVLRPRWSRDAGGAPWTRGHFLSVCLHQLTVIPPHPSDHIGSPTFPVSKITVSKDRRKTAVSRFCLEEKGFRDSKRKRKHLSILISTLKGKRFSFAFCWNWTDESPQKRKSRGQQLKHLSNDASLCLLKSVFKLLTGCLRVLEVIVCRKC